MLRYANGRFTDLCIHFSIKPPKSSHKNVSYHLNIHVVLSEEKAENSPRTPATVFKQELKFEIRLVFEVYGRMHFSGDDPPFCFNAMSKYQIY